MRDGFSYFCASSVFIPILSDILRYFVDLNFCLRPTVGNLHPLNHRPLLTSFGTVFESGDSVVSRVGDGRTKSFTIFVPVPVTPNRKTRDPFSPVLCSVASRKPTLYL